MKVILDSQDEVDMKPGSKVKTPSLVRPRTSITSGPSVPEYIGSSMGAAPSMINCAFLSAIDGLLFCCIESVTPHAGPASLDRKSTRLNSSHVKISYAVFC